MAKIRITEAQMTALATAGVFEDDNESILTSAVRGNSAREHLKAQRVINTYKSEEGLRVDGAEVREAVSYAETGSAEIRAKSRNNQRFSSTTKPKTVTLEIDAAHRTEPFIVRVARNVAKVFGRE